MATVSIDKVDVFQNIATSVTPTSVGEGDTVKLDYSGADYRTALIVTNGSAANTLTVSGGNGYAGDVDDLTLEIEASKIGVVVLDSGYYKNLSGTDAGKVVLTASKACTAVLVELP